MIERFARLQTDDLNADQLRWCRMWTVIWCAFFVVNGSIALVLSWAPLVWWAAYNGGLAYGLIGLLLGTEYLLRKRRFGKRT